MWQTSLRHKKFSTIPDAADADLVRSSDWNAEHNLWLGYRDATTLNDLIDEDDHLAIVRYNNSVATLVTLDTPNLHEGFGVKLLNIGSGSVTIPAGVSINGSSLPHTLEQGETLELRRTDTLDYVGVFAKQDGGVVTDLTLTGTGTMADPLSCPGVDGGAY
jgi:hypothetical protein